MASLALEDLGSDVVRRAANRAFFLPVEVQLGSQSEVAQLDFHFVVQE